MKHATIIHYVTGIAEKVLKVTGQRSRSLLTPFMRTL